MKAKRLRSVQSWPLALLAVALTACTAHAVAANTTPKTSPQAGCVNFSYVEKAVKVTYHDAPPAGPSVGDSGTYHDIIYNSAGKRVGTSLGTAWIVATRPSDGDLVAYYKETIFLGGGTLYDSTVMDFTRMGEGSWEHFNIVGVSGKYHGMFGERNMQILDRGQRTVTLRLHLCHTPPKL